MSCLQLSIQERKHSDPGPDSVTVDTLTFITAPSALVDLELDVVPGALYQDMLSADAEEEDDKEGDNSDTIDEDTTTMTIIHDGRCQQERRACANCIRGRGRGQRQQ